MQIFRFNNFLLVTLIIISGTAFAQEHITQNQGNLINKILGIYDKDDVFLNAGKINQSKKNHLSLYGNLLVLENTLLKLPERLKKGIGTQNNILDNIKENEEKDRAVVEQDSINHLINYSLNELASPQLSQSLKPEVLNGVRQDLTSAGVASFKASKNLSSGSPEQILRKNQEDVAYYLDRALKRLNSNQNQKENQNENNSNNKNAGQSRSQNSKNHDNNKNKSGENQENNQSNPQQANRKNEQNSAENKNSGKPPAENKNSRLSQATKQSLKDINQYENYKQDEKRQRLKQLGLSEDETKQFINPRLPVDKNW